MNKIIFICLIFFINTLFAQNDFCGFDKVHQNLLENNVEYQESFDLYKENLILAIQNQEEIDDKIPPLYTVPCVVHVIHLGEEVGVGSNISDEQIYSAINSLNDAYRNRGTQYTGSDSEIEFCLASRDPIGLPTNGINRINGTGIANYENVGMTVIGGSTNEVTIKALSRWEKDDYFNIWIVSEIDNNEGDGGIQGFAYFPNAFSIHDGAVILYNAFGYDPNGTCGHELKSYTNSNTTAIHELGHAFSLYHTFEGDDGDNDGIPDQCPANGNCNSRGDEICDTPSHQRSRNNCSTGTTNPCTGTLLDLVIHNFMDYSDCQTEFTPNQITRMRATLSSGGRQGFLNSNGCQSPIVPFSEFGVDCGEGISVCEGSVISFKDESINGPTSWKWSFLGGTPATSIERNPIITYNTAGTYPVTLTTSNDIGNNTKSKINYITVYDTPNKVCQPVTAFSIDNNDIGISNVSFNTINYNSQTSFNDNGNLNLVCNESTSVDIGSLYDLSITFGGTVNHRFKVYIDYNGNGDFDDTGELVFSGESSTLANSSIMIPTTGVVTDELVVMRIIADYENSATITNGCHQTEYGQHEDYGVFLNAAVLPIDLLSFDVEAEDCNIKINWETLTEENNESFIVEKSLNGIDFEYLTTIKGKNNASGALYSTQDEGINGLVYYRLKQKSFDGKEILLQTKVIETNCFDLESSTSIYPNPTSDLITIDTKEELVGMLTVFDVHGKLIYNKSLFNQSLSTIQVNDWAKGIYVLKLTSGVDVVTKKIIVQ